jgi:hypothetical protein
MKKTEIITCNCEEPDIEYLDRRYTDHWVCAKCHKFGGCSFHTESADNQPTTFINQPILTRRKKMNGDNDMQHLEDKLDDFRNAVHDKVLGYGSYARGIGVGLLIAAILVFLLLAVGIYNFNPIVQPNTGGGMVAPTPTTPFPSLP